MTYVQNLQTFHGKEAKFCDLFRENCTKVLRTKTLVIDKCTKNVRNASVGLCTDALHQPASNFNGNGGVFSATKYKSMFQTDSGEEKIHHSEL